MDTSLFAALLPAMAKAERAKICSGGEAACQEDPLQEPPWSCQPLRLSECPNTSATEDHGKTLSVAVYKHLTNGFPEEGEHVP